MLQRLTDMGGYILQHAARCTLQPAATHCNALQRTATHCNALQRTATHCNTLQRTATHCNALQPTATHCNTLQPTAIHCNTLRHTATHCNALKKMMKFSNFDLNLSNGLALYVMTTMSMLSNSHLNCSVSFERALFLKVSFALGIWMFKESTECCHSNGLYFLV